ncbi:glycosyltransferase family 2 protein [Acidisoma cellulosilytica]|uniref:Glycosyltransferase family 2 protein n=1 Tax=Acidisoma cellulosilyticum TaxID=2802395 RepID=A0A964E592_9PROT|nr:glycosyltransferase family 2 protein [Acidisoma cellulosilyticum]MCB8882465.1 glycosyltransferase family 2 protein [Acidisoma cellulosilyticum]
MKLAAVTMVYNEPDYMDLWRRHYGAQVGPENCFVIDHGSDDGTTDDLGVVNIIRLARSPQDDDWRSKLISDFAAELLGRYDCVLYTDIDEILVADPRYHRNLADAARAMRGPVMHAIGLEVWHLAKDEPAIDLARPISDQRSWVWFNSALCKPNLIREPMRWVPGFHSVDAPLAFDKLYLFHLRYFDVERGLSRLARTRAMPWANDHAGLHQRQPDEAWLRLVRDVANLPKARDADLDTARPPLGNLLQQTIGSQLGRETDTYKIDLGIHGLSLLPIPRRFKGRF